MPGTDDIFQANAQKWFIDQWSDEKMHEAEAFADEFKDILIRFVGINQLYGMKNAIELGVGNLFEYIDGRAERAVRANNSRTEDFYRAMRREIETVQQDVNVAIAKNDALRWGKETLTVEFIKKYLQHLIAETIFISSKSGR